MRAASYARASGHEGPEMREQPRVARASGPKGKGRKSGCVKTRARAVRACLMADKESGVNSVIPEHPQTSATAPSSFH